MANSSFEIATPSGKMKTELLVPEGAGPFGAVIFLVDGGGYRPTLLDIAQRISKMGCLVAIPDLFFRSGSPLDLLEPNEPRDMSSFEKVFGNPEKRQRFFTDYYSRALDYANLREEIAPLISEIEKRKDFNGRIGTTGYCMGGNASLRVAALFGDKIAAAASFHGGGLASDQPDSPHLRAKDMKAKIYVAGAIEDQSFPDTAKATLIKAFEEAHVDAKVETYQAHHGFVVSDHSTYDAAAAQRHDQALASFYGENLTKAS